MKRILLMTLLALSTVMVVSIKNETRAQGGVGVSITYQDFYDQLSPYGQWIDNPEYGYVWMPDAGSDFSPYRTNGHWVWNDDYDWMWVSDFDWGWAPFHYGRWFSDPSYGWVWVPGYEWSPGWVAWRDGGDYYGWAPLRPGFNISIGFSSYNPPIDYWCFTPRRYIASRNIYNYCVPSYQNINIYNNTTIINNYGRRTNNIFVSGGPRRRDAERYAGRINNYRVREVNAPGRNGYGRNSVSFYRPNVRQDNTRNYAPRQFDNANNRSNGGSPAFRNRDNDRPVGRNGFGRNNTDNRVNTGRTAQGNSSVTTDRNNNETPRNGFSRNQAPANNNNRAFNNRNREINNRTAETPGVNREPAQNNNTRPFANRVPDNQRQAERRDVFQRNQSTDNNAANGFGRRDRQQPAPERQRTVDQPQQRRVEANREMAPRSFEVRNQQRTENRAPQQQRQFENRAPQQQQRSFENRAPQQQQQSQSRSSENRGGGFGRPRH